MTIKPLAALCLAAAFCAVTTGAQAAFCESYRQTSSTAGPCKDCTLELIQTGEKGYAVRSNNGWMAKVRWRGDNANDVFGRGRWPVQNDAAFSIRLVSIGANMQMRMTIDGGLDFTARFSCND